MLPRLSLITLLLALAVFLALVSWRAEQPLAAAPLPSHDRVVIAAPVLVGLYGGDRFLAANLETIRLSATGINYGVPDDFYLIRAHKVVSELNPCHENNYYLANALLTWGGAVEEGGDILVRATDCRHWDELPPFLYGFNQYFFNRNIPAAQTALEQAALRSEHNADGYRRLAITIAIEQIEDEKIALEMLRQERDRAESARLVGMLNQRVERLEGLVLLRDAQRAYEAQTGQPLSDPGLLIAEGYLAAFPNDPMRWGYEFKNGQFHLRRVRVAGVEE